MNERLPALVLEIDARCRSGSRCHPPRCADRPRPFQTLSSSSAPGVVTSLAPCPGTHRRLAPRLQSQERVWRLHRRGTRRPACRWRPPGCRPANRRRRWPRSPTHRRQTTRNNSPGIVCCVPVRWRPTVRHRRRRSAYCSKPASVQGGTTAGLPSTRSGNPRAVRLHARRRTRSSLVNPESSVWCNRVRNRRDPRRLGRV